MYIYEILINNKSYASVKTLTEAETVQGLLFEYLEVEDIDTVTIKEDKKMIINNYALIYVSGCDEVITKYETEGEAEQNAFHRWSYLTETERRNASRFELVYFEDENNFDNFGEYNETLINFLNKVPYLFNSVTSEYLTEEEAINEYHEILEEESKPHTDIYDVCDGLNGLDFYGCGASFDVIYKWIE